MKKTPGTTRAQGRPEEGKPKTAKEKSFRWVGPFRLRSYLEKVIDDNQVWPTEEKNGVYVVSQRLWKGLPTKDAGILYVGGNTEDGSYFISWVGSLVIDMLGLWLHHSGGQSIWKYCRKNGIHPLDLFLGWVEPVECRRCAEAEVNSKLNPVLCKKKPASCKKHSPPQVEDLFSRR